MHVRHPMDAPWRVPPLHAQGVVGARHGSLMVWHALGAHRQQERALKDPKLYTLARSKSQLDCARLVVAGADMLGADRLVGSKIPRAPVSEARLLVMEAVSDCTSGAASSFATAAAAAATAAAVMPEPHFSVARTCHRYSSSLTIVRYTSLMSQGYLEPVSTKAFSAAFLGLF